MSYKHFTIEERELILKYLTLELSIAKIAKRLNRNKSSISREVRRNCINGEYSSFKAQENYKQNKQIYGIFKIEGNFRISFKTIASDALNVLAKQVLRCKGNSKKHGSTETREKIKISNCRYTA